MTSTVLVPGGHGRAIDVAPGWLVTVENVAGGQVADLFAFNADDPSEHLSAAHTRAHNWSLFPRIGQSFVTNRRRPMLTVEADDLGGAHDMLIPACDPERYRLLGAPNHRSCVTNLRAAMEEREHAVVEPPQPVNLFMPVPPGPRGDLALVESPARPGDRVVLRAEMAMTVVVSACPQDLVPLNAGGLSDVRVRVEAPGPGGDLTGLASGS